jgi:hypothetical protein
MASIKQVTEAVERQEHPVAVPIYGLDAEPYYALDGTPATISVVGSESKRMRKFEDVQRERIRQGVFQMDNPLEEYRRRVERVVEAVAAWHGWDDGEKELECTSANVRAFFSTEEAEHILRQVERGISGHGVFSKASSGG